MALHLYVPSTPPGGQTPETVSFAQYIFRELLAISKTFTEQPIVQLQVQHGEPEKPREGMLVFADGTDWNPGGGRGVYVYSSSAWVKL